MEAKKYLGRSMENSQNEYNINSIEKNYLRLASVKE
jgi:hypothetical protein